jgi:phosphopantetheinyl transferase
MRGICTRYVPITELPRAGRALEEWLSPDERRAYAAMRSSQRQNAWLVGRMVAKQLLREMLAAQDHPLAAVPANVIQIESRCPRTRRGERPVVFIAAERRAYALTITHTQRGVLVAASLSDEFALGVDLVLTDVAADKLAWTFTRAERCWLTSAAEQHGAEQLWSMKEALYKACQRGEGFSPQRIEVVPGQTPRYPGCDAERELVCLQTWRVDGQCATLAVVRLTNYSLAT